MKESPRVRRLNADNSALRKLAAESSIFNFECTGRPPQQYRVYFHGLGVWRMEDGSIAVRDEHQVMIELGAAYPRMIPGLQWQTPIFHPNISSSGVVCLGGYGTHWVPSLTLDELCVMLWDMIRYKNYDTESPYNREAALWAKAQTQFGFPLDKRSLRDTVSGEATVSPAAPIRNSSPPPVIVKVPGTGGGSHHQPSDNSQPEIEIIEATVQSPSAGNAGSDIVFID